MCKYLKYKHGDLAKMQYQAKVNASTINVLSLEDFWNPPQFEE